VGDPVRKEQKTAKKNTQNVDSPTRHVVKKASQDVPSEGLGSWWVVSELGCLDAALYQATQNADNNGDSFSIIRKGILLPPVPSQAQILGNPLPSSSLVAWGHAAEMDDWLGTSPPTNKTAKKTNRLSLRTHSRDVKKLDGDKNWLKAH
jgi:hypothetical protein